MADESEITDIICPICGKEEKHDPFFEPYEIRTRTQLERACGFVVSPVAFHPLCSSCKEWLLYLATENLLNEDKIAYLKGSGDGQHEKEQEPDV